MTRPLYQQTVCSTDCLFDKLKTPLGSTNHLLNRRRSTDRLFDSPLNGFVLSVGSFNMSLVRQSAFVSQHALFHSLCLKLSERRSTAKSLGRPTP